MYGYVLECIGVCTGIVTGCMVMYCNDEGWSKMGTMLRHVYVGVGEMK
jgi:hypothetical protein